MELNVIDKVNVKYTIFRGSKMDNYKLTSQSEHGGFKVFTYIENLPNEEREQRDQKMVNNLIKLVHRSSKKKEEDSK